MLHKPEIAFNFQPVPLRHREVALLVARGLSNKEVARELGISGGTVKIHMHSIFQKLGTKSRYSLVILAGSADAA